MTIIRRLVPIAVLLAMAGVAAIVIPEFYSPRNLPVLIRQAAPLVLLAIAQTIVLIGRGIDLSQGAVMQVTAIALAAWATRGSVAVLLVLVAMLGLAAMIGLANGLLSTRGRVAPLIATLAVGITVTGVRLVLTRGTATGAVPAMIRELGTGNTIGVPNALMMPVAVATVTWMVLRWTTAGRRLYATGANPQAARAAGVRVERVVIVSYVAAAILAALAGVALAGNIGFVDRNIGAGAVLDSLAAAILGGASFAGGQGSVGGTIAGVIALVIMFNLLLLVGLPPGAQLVAKAFVIIGGLTLYGRLRSMAA